MLEIFVYQYFRLFHVLHHNYYYICYVSGLYLHRAHQGVFLPPPPPPPPQKKIYRKLIKIQENFYLQDTIKHTQLLF